MLIEFLGAPGTGKTTLASMVTHFLQEQGLSALTIGDAVPLCAARTLWGKAMSSVMSHSWQSSAWWRVYSYTSSCYRIQFAVENYAFWRYVVKLQRGRIIPREHQRLIRWYLNRMMGLYQFCKCHLQPDEILILDEGFAHRVTHFVSDVEQPDPGAIMRYVELMPRTDISVRVRAPVNTCVERIWVRGLGGRLGGKSKQEVTRFVANSAQAIDISARHLRLMGRDVVEIDNDGNLNVCVTSLETQLKEIVGKYTPDGHIVGKNPGSM